MHTTLHGRPAYLAGTLLLFALLRWSVNNVWDGWCTATAVIGDCWHRFYVRMLELVESIEICEQGLQRYPTAQGTHRADQPKHLPAGEAYVETECPRGQMGFYVVGRPSKDSVPLRVRAKSSSFCNLSVTNEICRGCLIADIPAIVGSIDIVMGEIDR